MLDPYERELMLDTLRPPDGFALDHAVGTTYSLDLLALLAAPLAFSILADGDAPSADPLVLLEALQSHAERITLFCDAGRIYVPPADRLLFSRLEESVVECRAPQGGSFHPKVWLLRYIAGGEVAYRLICMSRNLTFDRCWDTAVALDGVLGRRRGYNAPLAEFVQALPDMAVQPFAGRRRAAIEQLGDDVRRVEWEVPEPYREVGFHPLGHTTKPSRSPFASADSRIDRLLVVAPFVSGPLLALLTERGSRHQLVSRADQLDAVEPSYLEGFEHTLVLDEGVLAEDQDDASDTLRGLHAKLFVADQGWYATTWTGSANATRAAFADNVEFLVSLKGMKSQVGIEEFTGADDHGTVTLRSLLLPYERSDQPTDDLEAQRELERTLDGVRRSLAAAGLRARVSPGEGGTWAIAIEMSGSVTAPAELMSLDAWPITRQRETGARAVVLGEPVIAQFDRLAVERLTPFIAFRVALANGETSLISDFVLRLPLLDAPSERQAAITRSLLSNRKEVLRYLIYLLSGTGIEATQALTDGEPSTASGGGRASSSALPLLESLLRTLDRDPGRLAAVRRIVDELQQVENGAELFPDGWDEIWGPVDAVARDLPA